MKKIYNKLKKLYKNSSLFRIFIILLIGALIIFEGKNIYVDHYNFQQLEKAKKAIENLDGEQKYYFVNNLGSLNYKFDIDIEPLDKRYCYEVYYSFDEKNNKPNFKFGFKLHSLLYKLMYLDNKYAYPKKIVKSEPSEACKEERKLPYMGLTGMPACAGLNAYYYRYLRVINNPCKK